jgi:hypothetical protein
MIERIPYDPETEDFFKDEDDDEILYCPCGWEGPAREAKELVIDTDKQEGHDEFICPKCRETEWG